MIKLKLIFITLVIQFLVVVNAHAGDFAWLDKLSIEARADASGFKARIAARFHIGDAKVSAIIRDVGGHADAYMVLRLAEMSHLSIDTVIGRYHRNKGKGWGVLAKSLGIKPGSSEFHALKRGHDLNGGGSAKNKKHKHKEKGNGKGGKDKGKGKN